MIFKNLDELHIKIQKIQDDVSHSQKYGKRYSNTSAFMKDLLEYGEMVKNKGKLVNKYQKSLKSGFGLIIG
ncbi:MAG: hypothetical protein CO170_02225 [candidate division SR1 bacterium CG_4_9_14_3_um_filter_40_9]|nr:MAG: hypothetical protein CO170_02225 [candidate division SR1 bacterium CG_4_9_14_3_um_filter_40_9]